MTCSECDRLRAAFQRTVQRNIELLEEYTPAVLKHDEARVRSLREQLTDVEARRREARLKLELHEEAHQPATMTSLDSNGCARFNELDLSSRTFIS